MNPALSSKNPSAVNEHPSSDTMCWNAGYSLLGFFKRLYSVMSWSSLGRGRYGFRWESCCSALALQHAL